MWGENSIGAFITVNLNIAAGVTLQDAATFSVTAVDIDTTAADYTANTTSVTFASGSGNGATESATISPTDDNLVEGDEDVRLDLAYSSGAATLGAQDSHTVTIQDADLASVEFALAASSAGENAGGHNVVVNLNIAAGVTLQDAATFSVSAVDIDTTGTDYNLNTTSVTFASGSGNGATETATITPVDDNLVEGDEDVRLDLAYSSGAATLGAQDQHTVTIQDADLASVEFDLASSSVGEKLDWRIYHGQSEHCCRRHVCRTRPRSASQRSTSTPQQLTTQPTQPP